MVVDERKYNKKVLFIALISLAVYAIIFSMLIVIGDMVFSGVIINKADRAVSTAIDAAVKNAPIDIFEAQEKYPEVSIAYFDSEDKLLNTRGNYYDVYSKLGDLDNVGKIITSSLKDQRYRTATYDMLVEGNAVKVKVYYPLEPLYNLKKLVVLYVISAFCVVLVVVVVVSYVVSNRIAKPYIELAKKNNQLIYDTAHELNTPLAVIGTQISNVINSGEIVEKQEEELYIAKEELSRLKRLIKEMLMLAKVENDMLPLVAKKVDINNIVADIVEPYAIISEEAGKSFVVDCAKVFFNTDEDKLRQMFHIVLDNAVKYTLAGESIFVNVKKEQDKLKITIADTGIGVPEQDLEKIFNKFYRVDVSRTKTTGGNGIGLALLKAIIVNMGGKLTASCNSPKGLILDITLVEMSISNT